MRIGNLIGHIPARGGSKRVPSKNLRYLAGRPMISYAIECGLACPDIPQLYVNTDSDAIAAFARLSNIDVYRRPNVLGSDSTSGEEFTADIINALRPDTLLMISPVCPLIEPTDISAALKAYEASDADTLISCSVTTLQTFCKGEPVNIRLDGPLAPSQENPPVTICNWAVTIWNAEVFMSQFKKNRSGYFGDKRLLWPIDPLKAVKVSTEQDFLLADELIRAKRDGDGSEPEYARYWRQIESDGKNDLNSD